MVGMTDPIASAFCSNCLREAQTSAGDSIAKILVAVPQIPSEYDATHVICPSCLELRQRNDRHAERCELGLAGLALHSAGWATPLSQFLRRDLRARRPRWTKLTASLLGALVQSFRGIGKVVLVPIPVSGQGRDHDGLRDAVSLAGDRSGIPVVCAIRRKKRRSTRQSGAQVRRRIVEEEYELDAKMTVSIRGKQVVLVDDTVTTGATMSGIARLLRSSGAASVVPISLDRTVSARLQQRLSEGMHRGCAHVTTRAGQ
jgi:predicted amidophosphoribosyltransferase